MSVSIDIGNSVNTYSHINVDIHINMAIRNRTHIHLYMTICIHIRNNTIAQLIPMRILVSMLILGLISILI